MGSESPQSRIWAWAGLLLVCPRLLLANGTTGADILLARVGTRASAMGQTYVALGDDLLSIQYNPAGLADLQKPAVSVLHEAAIAQVQYEYLSWGQHFPFGALAASVTYRHMPDINNPGAVDSAVSAYDALFTVSYADHPARFFPQWIPPSYSDLSAGVTLKFLRSHLASYDAYTGALDAGIKKDLGGGIEGGLAVANLGPPIQFISVADPLPAEAMAGLAKELSISRNNQLRAAGDFEYPFDGDPRMHGGIEDTLAGILALRAGYILENAQSLGGFTAGLGIRLEQAPLVFHFDYSYQPVYYDGFSSFEPQHLLSMELEF